MFHKGHQGGLLPSFLKGGTHTTHSQGVSINCFPSYTGGCRIPLIKDRRDPKNQMTPPGNPGWPARGVGPLCMGSAGTEGVVTPLIAVCPPLVCGG